MTKLSARRGEIWTVDLRAGRGSEQRGLRPALIIQNDVGNRYAATTIVAAITTTIKIYPVTVPLEAAEGGLGRRSMVNLSQIFTIDQERLRRKLGSLSTELMELVDRAIKASLDVA
ncbi:MAG: type II toxin-antitoxin system PemK/MazF family toxin [Candidatus Rokuibacteriota bacterium]